MKKTIIGIIVMILAIVGVLGWELFGRETLLFSDILVLNQNVKAFQQISKDMLAVKKVYTPNPDALTIPDAEKLIGMITKQDIHGNAELFPEYFTAEDLSVNENSDEYIYSLQVKDLKSYPRSIRKGDTVYLYNLGKLITETTVLRIMDGTTEVIPGMVNKETGQAEKQVIDTIEVKLTAKQVSAINNLISNEELISIAYN